MSRSDTIRASLRSCAPTPQRRWWLASACALLLAVVLTAPGGCDRTGKAPAHGDVAPLTASQEETARLLAELTQAVRKYGAEQRQVPKSLDDLVAQGYLQRVPTAPAGKQFTITPRLEVQLVNR